MKRITVPAKLESLETVTSFVNGELEQYDCPVKILLKIQLAVEEIFVNVASYAYQPKDGDAEICCDVLEDPLRVEIQILDSGQPFDPLAREEADTSEEALLRREGGLGILLVCRTMDSVRYSYENGKNILTILKSL